jgi:hypothetical protein
MKREWSIQCYVQPKKTIMKKLMIAVSMFVLGVSTMPMALAKDATNVATVLQADEKVKVKVEELPEAIKTTLASEPYSAWKAEAALLNKTKDYYEIEVKKGVEKKTIKLSKDGKAVE